MMAKYGKIYLSIISTKVKIGRRQIRFFTRRKSARWEIQYQVDTKRKYLNMKDYLFCHNCLMRDYDTVLEKTDNCPIFGSNKLEIVHIREVSD